MSSATTIDIAVFQILSSRKFFFAKNSIQLNSPLHFYSSFKIGYSTASIKGCSK